MKIKINKRKYINYVRKFVPVPLRPKFDSIIDWLKYVAYQRWYRTKFLGAFNFARYMAIKRPNINNSEKKILAITDFKAVGFALGSFIEFQTRLLCEAYLNEINKIDFAFVYNPKKPVNHWKDASWVNSDNFHLHFADLIPLLNINPKLGSAFVFNSHNDFESFLKINSKNYILLPSLFNYVNKNKIARGNFGFIRNFYLKHKFLPKLEISDFVSLWTRAFIKKYVKGKYLIAVNLRSNPLFDDERNAAVDTWEQFFTHCFKKHPDVIFVILGRKNEITEKLKSPNVIFAQDHNINIQHTLSFIKHSLFYMATSSGPASFAILSTDIPYINIRFRAPDISYNYNWFKPGTVLPWQNKEFQKLIWGKETPQLLIKEFEDLLGKVDKEKWKKELELDNIDSSILDWPFLVKRS